MLICLYCKLSKISHLLSNMQQEIGPFCLYWAWLVMDDWLIIIGFKTTLTMYKHWKASGVFLFFYFFWCICDRNSPGGWSQTKQRLVSKVLRASALVHFSPAAGYLKELSYGEERQSKSSCQSFDVWHSFFSECNLEHKQSCTLWGGETFEVLLIYIKKKEIWLQLFYVSADNSWVS